MPQRLKTDHFLFGAVLVLVVLGLVMIYSASSVTANLRYHNPYYFLMRQFLWIVPAVLAMMLLKRTHYRDLQSPAAAFGAVGVVLILLLLVFPHRWFRVGPLSLQPSELAKPALVLFLAFFVAMRARAINDRHTLFPALLIVLGLTVLVGVADLGTAMVLLATATVVFLVAGLDWRYFAIAVLMAVLGAGIAVASKPYRLARVISYVDPEFKKVEWFDRKGRVKDYLKRSLTARDTRYQAVQSKIAVGAGGPGGLGLMQGRQKLLYLPEAHTDFIYAVVSEELGLIGSVGVLAAFVVILWRGLRASVRIPDEFGRYLALGITTSIVFQAFMNMSVVLDLMPTKGIPLPMISSGGSSLFSTLTLAGMLMNVSENAG
ncbi:MAG: cell division protein FtsW [Bryobacterales bacterium]|nr:cell division protein FtsW [Bryobacterales bacterium]